MKIGKNCVIHPTAVIAEENVVIGDNVVIEEFVVIHKNVTIADDVVVRAGAVLGGTGTVVNRSRDGVLERKRAEGKVFVGQGTLVGYHVLIERGEAEDEITRIGSHCIMDADAVISAGCIMEDNVMVLTTVYAGKKSVIEEYARINPKAVIGDGVRVGKNAVVTIGAVVMEDVAAGMKVTGNYAMEHDKFLLLHREKLRK